MNHLWLELSENVPELHSSHALRHGSMNMCAAESIRLFNNGVMEMKLLS